MAKTHREKEMKLIDTMYNKPPATAADCHKMELPGIKDLHEILKRNVIVNHCLENGINAGLSTEQTLILIIQGLDRENERLLEELESKLRWRVKK